MLELYFKYPNVLRRLRWGVLGEEMDRIAAHFFEVGYKRESAKIYICRIARFSNFAARYGGTAPIDQNVIDGSVRSIPTATSRATARTAIGHAHRLAPHRFSPDRHLARDPDGPVLTAYLDYLRQIRGLAPKTCEGMLMAARRILAWYHGQVPGQSLAAVTGEQCWP